MVRVQGFGGLGSRVLVWGFGVLSSGLILLSPTSFLV